MRKLSSSLTVYYKRMLPLACGLLLAGIGGMAWLDQRQHHPGAVPWLLLLGIAAAAAVVVATYFGVLRGLADEVAMDEVSLLVRKGGEEGRIALADIAAVRCARLTNPRRIVLTLRRDSRFGRVLRFIPATTPAVFGQFRADPIAQDLARRVAAARRAP